MTYYANLNFAYKLQYASQTSPKTYEKSRSYSLNPSKVQHYLL